MSARARRRVWLGAALVLLGAGSAKEADAHPQANASLTLGVVEVGQRSEPFDKTRFSLGGRADILFLREANTDFAVGPYAELLTATFDDLQVGGGASVLLPVHDYLPLVLSAGGYARHTSSFGWEPGAAAALFWGSRSHNFHSVYGMVGGLLIQGRYGLGESKETAIIVGAQVDLMVLGLPFLIAYEALVGPSGGAAPP